MWRRLRIANVRLQAEVSLVVLARLVHLRVALAALFLVELHSSDAAHILARGEG